MVFGHKTIMVQDFPVISFMGQLIDKSQATELMADIDKFIAEGKCKFVFDFSKLKYINSNGLGVIITLLTRARKNGGEIAICALNKKVQELLLMTKLNTVFPVTKTVDRAILKLK